MSSHQSGLLATGQTQQKVRDQTKGPGTDLQADQVSNELSAAGMQVRVQISALFDRYKGSVEKVGEREILSLQAKDGSSLTFTRSSDGSMLVDKATTSENGVQHRIVTLRPDGSGVVTSRFDASMGHSLPTQYMPILSPKQLTWVKDEVQRLQSSETNTFYPPGQKIDPQNPPFPDLNKGMIAKASPLIFKNTQEKKEFFLTILEQEKKRLDGSGSSTAEKEAIDMNLRVVKSGLLNEFTASLVTLNGKTTLHISGPNGSAIDFKASRGIRLSVDSLSMETQERLSKSAIGRRVVGELRR